MAEEAGELVPHEAEEARVPLLLLLVLALLASRRTELFACDSIDFQSYISNQPYLPLLFSEYSHLTW